MPGREICQKRNPCEDGLASKCAGNQQDANTMTAVSLSAEVRPETMKNECTQDVKNARNSDAPTFEA